MQLYREQIHTVVMVQMNHIFLECIFKFFRLHAVNLKAVNELNRELSKKKFYVHKIKSQYFCGNPL